MPQNLECGGQQLHRFVVPILDYESPSSRVKGFQDIFRLDLPGPSPMYIIGHEAFVEYEIYGGLRPKVVTEIGAVYDAIRVANPDRGAYVGRAFFVPGIDNPNGPRTAAIRNKDDFTKQVEIFWKFALENKYNVEGADIALVVHPFIDVMAARPYYGEIPVKENEKLPWTGGYVVPNPLPGRETLYKIVSTFGPDEAIQSSDADELDIDLARQTVISKVIALKEQTLVPRGGDRYNELTIPLRFQQEQSLTDAEALLVAREAQKIYAHRPNARIEFIMQPEGPYIREIAPWNPVDERELFKLPKRKEVSGEIIRINTREDIARIQPGQAIVFFGPEAFRSRTTDLFALVAHKVKPGDLIALVRGTLTTSHMARILSDAGHNVILVGNRNFRDGVGVRIQRGSDGTPQVEFLDPYENAMIALSDVGRLRTGEAGNKVARLAIMLHYGIPTPDGFAISSTAVFQHLSDLGLTEQISRLDRVKIDGGQSRNQLKTITTEIQEKILSSPLPPSLVAQIKKATEQYGFLSYAIRSSGSEDGLAQSRAGLYQSVTDVTAEEIPDKLRQTIASYYSEASIITMRRSGEQPSRMTVGVGIHEFIPETPKTIGAVLFTSAKEFRIEAACCSIDTIVSGSATDYLKILVSRTTGNNTIEPIGEPAITISKETIDRAVDLAERIERIFQSDQDIELLITPDRGIVIVQARPR